MVSKFLPQGRRVGADLVKEGAQAGLAIACFNLGEKFMHGHAALIAGAVGGQVGPVGTLFKPVAIGGQPVGSGFGMAMGQRNAGGIFGAQQHRIVLKDVVDLDFYVVQASAHKDFSGQMA